MVDDLFDISDDGIVLKLHVQPGAGRTAVTGRFGDAIRLKVAAPPEGGRANDACIKAVAEMLGVAAASVEVVGGETSRTKRVLVRQAEVEAVRRLLEQALDAASTAGGQRRPAPGSRR